MRHNFYLIPVLLSAILLCAFIAPLSAAETKGKSKEVILTNADIKDSYKIIGIVSVKTGETNLDSLNDKLRGEAEDIGADYVVGVNYFYVQGGYLYAYGTAVKVKE